MNPNVITVVVTTNSIYIIILHVKITAKKMKRHGNKFSLFFLGQHRVETDDFLKRMATSVPVSNKYVE